MAWRGASVCGCAVALLLAGCRGDFAMPYAGCKDAMSKDGIVFRICESATTVTFQQLGPATSEQLRMRYQLRETARKEGLAIFIRDARQPVEEAGQYIESE